MMLDMDCYGRLAVAEKYYTVRLMLLQPHASLSSQNRFRRTGYFLFGIEGIASLVRWPSAQLLAYNIIASPTTKCSNITCEYSIFPPDMSLRTARKSSKHQREPQDLAHRPYLQGCLGRSALVARPRQHFDLLGWTSFCTNL